MPREKNPDRLISTPEAAELLGLSASMLERLRWAGDGPPYIHPTGGRVVRYRISDLTAWIERCRVDPGTSRPEDVR